MASAGSSTVTMDSEGAGTPSPVWERVASASSALGREDTESSSEYEPGHRFRDCPECAEMVVVPAGSYALYTLEGMEDPYQGRIKFAKPWAVGIHEVTFAEWDSCHGRGGCSHNPGDEGWGRGGRPVMNVSWKYAQEFVRWLSKETGRLYRLMSEFEWEYAARGGSKTNYPWGRRREETVRIAPDVGVNGMVKRHPLRAHSLRMHMGCTTSTEMFGNGWRTVGAENIRTDTDLYRGRWMAARDWRATEGTAASALCGAGRGTPGR